MSIIDTSGLEDWPDPASFFSAASSLMEHGASFAEHVEGAHSTWKGLGACYETPHQDLLYSGAGPGPAVRPARFGRVRQRQSGHDAVRR